MVRARSSSVKGQTAAAVPDDGENVLFSVWLVARATADLLDKALAASGLDADEFAVYSVLTSAPTLTPTELAKWMAAPPTTMSSYVKRFEARGHVVREPNPHDGRSYRLRLTDAGREAHRRAAELFTPALGTVVEALGDQEPTIRSALLTLRAALDQARGQTA